MTEHFIEHYRVLDLRPGTTWKDLRKAYKHRIRLWHPDRFPQDSEQRSLAEERAKEITTAFRELEAYYRRHGMLPEIPIPTPSEDLSSGPSVAETAPSPTTYSTPATVSPDDVAAENTQPVPSGRHAWRRLVLTAVLLGGGYLAIRSAFQEQTDNFSGMFATTSQEIQKAVEAARQEKHGGPGASYFTVGSSLGDVYSIQGVPTKTEVGVWHYGASRVYFHDGRVTHWDEDSGTPLKVMAMSANTANTMAFFTWGSTKAEVLAAQGLPDRDAGNVWEYGASRVRFENNRVVSWYESPLYPLRIRH